MERKTKKNAKINFSEIPLDGSLGLLAYGDIAFTAWRKAKIDSRKKNNEEE